MSLMHRNKLWFAALGAMGLLVSEAGAQSFRLGASSSRSRGRSGGSVSFGGINLRPSTPPRRTNSGTVRVVPGDGSQRGVIRRPAGTPSRSIPFGRGRLIGAPIPATDGKQPATTGRFGYNPNFQISNSSGTGAEAAKSGIRFGSRKVRIPSNWRLPDVKPGTNRPDLDKLFGRTARRPNGDPWAAFANRLRSGGYSRAFGGTFAKQLNLHHQFELLQTGDVSRRLNLAAKVQSRGGWHKRWHGNIAPGYTKNCFSIWYCGASYYPKYCWYPTWSGWVDWAWSYHCLPSWDPRPPWCRPVACAPGAPWVWWDCPTWAPLPESVCGTWVDVPGVELLEQQHDVQLMAVRFVDPGHPEERLGPRFRVWARNNSEARLVRPMNVTLIAANGPELSEQLPQSGVRIDSMEANEVESMDVRLPFEVMSMGRTADGAAQPFSTVHVMVDSHRELSETDEANNGAVLATADILPVDPAAFGSDSREVVAGQVLTLAGEGLGPEPGQVIIQVAGLELQAEILGWYDLGVRVRIPDLAVADGVAAEIVVVRGDTAVSNPVPVQIVPRDLASSQN